MRRALKTVGSVLASGVLAAAIAVPGTAQAAEIGQVCNAGADWVIYQSPSGGFHSYIFYGDGFRITGYDGDYYRGHKNGQTVDGYLQRWVINQSTCHW